MRRAGAVLVFLAASIFTSVLFAPSALAHATLISSDPAEGARLDSVPDRVVLTFTEPVGVANGYVRVTDENGERVDDGSATADGPEVAVGLRSGLDDGSFLVSYRLTSADSHPISGALVFVVGDGPLVVPPDVEMSSDPLVSTAFGVVRWLSYLGLALLVGPLVIAALAWRADVRAPLPGRLFKVGFWLSVGAAVLSILLEALYVSGAPLSQAASIDLLAILSTTSGIAMVARLALLVVLALFVRWVWRTRLREPSPRKSYRRGPVWVGAALVVAIAITFSVSGHPIAAPIPALAVLSDVVHVFAMSVWLGGLLVLVVELLPLRDAEVLGGVLPRFSTVALFSIAALLISGTVQAVLEISPLAALWATSYGVLVTLKAIGLAVIVSVSYRVRAWLRTQYSSAKPRPEFERLRRTLFLEVGVAAIVLAVAAVLVATVPAHSAYAQPFAETVALPVDVALEPTAPGHYSAAGLSLPAPGVWELIVYVRLSEFSANSVTVEVPVN